MLVGLAATVLLAAGIQAAVAAPADAMIRQEKQEEECAEDGGWWESHFGACIIFGEDSDGGVGGGGGGVGGGGPGGGGGSDDGGSGGGGFGSGGDNPGSPDGSWDDSPGDDDLKDPLNPECFELQTDQGVYEVCPTGPSDIIIDDTGDDGVWDPETDRPKGPVIAMGGKKGHSARAGRAAHGRAPLRKTHPTKHRAKARAHRR